MANVIVTVSSPRAIEDKVVTGIIIAPKTATVMIHWRYASRRVPNVSALSFEELKRIIKAMRTGGALPLPQRDGGTETSYFGAVCGTDCVVLLFRDGPFLDAVPLPREVLEVAAEKIGGEESVEE